MENKNIATFVKVVEFNNFTKAAEYLGYSQAAVTAQIKTLEKELGVLLFDRIGKGIRLTQEGKTFLPYALNMLVAEAEAINSVRPKDDLVGELRICTASSYATEVLPKILLKYMEQHPKVNVIVKISDYLEDTTRKLARGEIDFLVCIDDENAHPEFNTVSKRIEPIIFVTYPTNPILQKKNIAITDILDNHFIISDKDVGYSSLLDRELKKRKIDLTAAMEIGSVNAIVNILLSGYGTSFIPKFMVNNYLEIGKLVEIQVKDINIDIYSYYLCNSQRWINPIMQEFINTVNKNI